MVRLIGLCILLHVSTTAWAIDAPANRSKEAIAGNGVEKTVERELKRFDHIVLRIPAEMHVTIGEPSDLKIQADENIIEHIDTTVKDGKLIISSKKSFAKKTDIEIFMSVAELLGVSVVGAGDMEVEGINNDKFSASATGAADLEVTGTTKSLALSAVGAADVEAEDLVAQTAAISLTGAADAEVHVVDSMTVTMTGDCDLSYKGSPQITKKIIGGGDIVKDDDDDDDDD